MEFWGGGCGEIVVCNLVGFVCHGAKGQYGYYLNNNLNTTI